MVCIQGRRNFRGVDSRPSTPLVLLLSLEVLLGSAAILQSLLDLLALLARGFFGEANLLVTIDVRSNYIDPLVGDSP